MFAFPLVSSLLPGTSRTIDMQQGASRRAFLAGAGATAASVLLPSHAAHASYAMQQAAVSQHTWEATDKARERAVYDSIEKSIDRKRPDRPELGECEDRPLPARGPAGIACSLALFVNGSGLRWRYAHQGGEPGARRVRPAPVEQAASQLGVVASGGLPRCRYQGGHLASCSPAQVIALQATVLYNSAGERRRRRESTIREGRVGAGGRALSSLGLGLKKGVTVSSVCD